MGLFRYEKGKGSSISSQGCGTFRICGSCVTLSSEKLVPTNESHTEECNAGSDFRVVQIPSVVLGLVQKGEYGCITGRCRSN